MKARATRAIAARSVADGGRTLAGLGASWARAGRGATTGKIEAQATIPRKSRRANFIRASPLPSIRCPSAGDIEHRAGREGAILRGKPCHHGGELFHEDKTVLRDFRQHEVDMLLGELVEDRSLGSRG